MIVRTLAVGASFIGMCLLPVAGPASAERDDFGYGFSLTYVTDSIDHHCELEVIVSMKAVGTSRFRCTLLDREQVTYDKRGQLTRQQTGDLRTLLRAARLFEGQYWGTDARGLDFSFDTLTVRAGRLATLVTRLNDSFQSGARKRLLDFLSAFMQTPDHATNHSDPGNLTTRCT